MDFLSKKEIAMVIICILICQGAGLLASVFTRDKGSWYENVKKPSFNPPGWVFGPVWISLYLLMGICLFLVLRKGFNSPGVKLALAVFALQLILNVLWTLLFFGMEKPGWAFIEIIFLLIVICTNAYFFWDVEKWAGYLFAPYFLWVGFASVLNLSIWLLNK